MMNTTTTTSSSNKEADEAQRQRLFALLTSTLPMDEVVYAFGYGSGVFSQQIGHDDNDHDKQEPKVIDLIIVVQDALAFHQANLEQNPSHYAFHYWLPNNNNNTTTTAQWCTWWQRRSPPAWLGRNPGVYFLLTDKFKYGVVQIDDLCADLQFWTCLYLAGRMHKPILPLMTTREQQEQQQSLSAHNYERIVHLQQTVNLPAALAMSLWRLSTSTSDSNVNNNNPRHVSDTQVYAQIAQLSYTGDFRVAYGAEDPQKITRLVQGPGQLQRFQALYAEAAATLQERGILSIESSTTTIDPKGTIDKDTTTTHWTWDASPSSLAFLQSQIPLPPPPYHLHKIVAPAARYQSFKGIVTAGPSRAWKYAIRKLTKGLLKR